VGPQVVRDGEGDSTCRQCAVYGFLMSFALDCIALVAGARAFESGLTVDYTEQTLSELNIGRQCISSVRRNA
jgi:hypothetical protein